MIVPGVIPFAVLAQTAITLAQSVSDGNPVIQYVNYGVLGLTVLAFIIGKVVPGFLYDRAEKRHVEEILRKDEVIDALTLENRRLNTYIADQVIPAIIRFTDQQARDIERRVKDLSRDDGR